MNRMQRATWWVLILALALTLVGCNTPTVEVSPTQDIPSIRTESAQTVVAKITIDAALNPTEVPATQPPAQPVVITATQAPTATATQALQLPTLAPTKTATARPATSSGTSGSSGVVYPTKTVRSGPDQAQLVSQEPKDGAVYGPGEEFDARWTFKNVGTSTWNANYRVNVQTDKGTQMAKADRYMIRDVTAPGASTTFIADMVAPTSAGRYVMYLNLANDNNSVFYTFYTVIDVK